MNLGPIRQSEAYRSGRSGWLRAAVLGSDDAIVSTASLMIGVAAASASKPAILIAGVAGLVAGSMSMAVGEYVSVSAQRDSEQADVALERQELADEPRAELRELAVDEFLVEGVEHLKERHVPRHFFHLVSDELTCRIRVQLSPNFEC